MDHIGPDPTAIAHDGAERHGTGLLVVPSWRMNIAV